MNFDCVIVGSGCAGLKCADELLRLGRKRVAVITDNVSAGTSLNAGSDKQTYYKLTLSGGDGDSVYDMAQTLFSGGCVDGDNALCEAALSAECFYKLCELGVEFPTNEYGEYVGYRTDHDVRRRATSAGPLTSRHMALFLKDSVIKRGGTILNGLTALRIIKNGDAAGGVICYDKSKGELVSVFSNNVVWATGGAAAIYADVCYPASQIGMSGAAFEAGASGVNLTEWQYGLASLKPRWNVSGTYMQVLPRFISTDENGGDAREFLAGGFDSVGDMLSNVFLKGYQWPFDARKAKDGSSQIDMLVCAEKRKGRRVFLDYTQNPEGFGFDLLSNEAREYLKSANAVDGTPYDRLLTMNAPAVDFYKSRGVDLKSDMLEIAVCAQHINGGIEVNNDWQTRVKGLYAIGEAAGTHGVYRPGGSALNAGQAGGTRAARNIAKVEECTAFEPDVSQELEGMRTLAKKCTNGKTDIDNLARKGARDMSDFAAASREINQIRRMKAEADELFDAFAETVRINDESEIVKLFRFRDALITRRMMLAALIDYSEHGGVSRGSAIYSNVEAGDDKNTGKIQQVSLENGSTSCTWREVRKIPMSDDSFENVWRKYRQSRGL